MKLVKLVRVLDVNSYLEKQDADAKRRAGRTFDLDKSFIVSGREAFLFCVYPDFVDSLFTSRVSLIIKSKTMIKLVTRNSIYLLEEVIWS